MIGSFIAWIGFGLVVGFLARAIYPGPQKVGLVGTLILGVVGSFFGGFVSYMLGDHPELGPLQGSGWMASIIGASLVIWAALKMQQHRALPR